MVVTAFDRLDADAIAQLPARLRILATYSVGVEHIDLDAAARRRIAVLSTPDVLSNSVAEMAILLMLERRAPGARGRGPALRKDLVRLDANAAHRHRVDGAAHRHPGHGAHWAHDRTARPRLRHERPLPQPPSPRGPSWRKMPTITQRSRDCLPSAMFSSWQRPPRRTPRDFSMARGSRSCPPTTPFWSTSPAAISSTTMRSSGRCDRAGSPAPAWTCSTMSRAWMPDTSIFPMSSSNRTRGVRRWRRGSRWQASCLPELTPSSPVRALQIGSFERPHPRGPGRRSPPPCVKRDKCWLCIRRACETIRPQRKASSHHGRPQANYKQMPWTTSNACPLIPVRTGGSVTSWDLDRYG